MRYEKYFYKGSTVLGLSFGICQVIAWDCANFGFVKNEKPNFSGFLNHLIPELSAYRDDLHEKFTRYSQGDDELAKQIEGGIYNIYLRSFDLNDDAEYSIPFRVNSLHRKDFELIYEEKLRKYDMDFTNYVRTLLGEYAIKPYYQRELFFCYRFQKEMQIAIQKKRICRYVNENNITDFIPVAIEQSFLSPGNYLLGISTDKQTPLILAWRDFNRLRITEQKSFLEDSDYELVAKKWVMCQQEGESSGVWEQII